MIVPNPAHYRLESLNERIAMLHVLTLFTVLGGEDAFASAMSINGHRQTLAHRIAAALPEAQKGNRRSVGADART